MKRKRACNDPDKEEPVVDWQITYSSLAMILAVIFAMLVSYSFTDKQKMGYLREAVRRETGVADVGDTLDKNGVSLNDAAGNNVRWIDYASASLKAAFNALGAKDGVVVLKVGDGIRMKFKSDLFFPSGSAMIDKAMYPYLDEVAGVVKKRNVLLRVEGHTDDVPVHTEEFPSNWELSTKRAVNIARYFIEKKGVPAECLSAEGFGQYRPLVREGTYEDKKQNRRIEIYIQPAGRSFSRGDK